MRRHSLKKRSNSTLYHRRQAASLQPFFDAALALKKVPRAGWAAKAGITDAESVADHSFSMCAMAMAVADLAGLDTLRVMKMVVLHDLAESITGDLMPGQVTRKEKKIRENAGMKKILAGLPSSLLDEYCKIWKEYNDDVTEIAHLVHRVDKLEMALQAKRYVQDGYPRADLQEFFRSAKSAASRKGDLVDLMLSSLRTGN